LLLGWGVGLEVTTATFQKAEATSFWQRWVEYLLAGHISTDPLIGRVEIVLIPVRGLALLAIGLGLSILASQDGNGGGGAGCLVLLLVIVGGLLLKVAGVVLSFLLCLPVLLWLDQSFILANPAASFAMSFALPGAIVGLIAGLLLLYQSQE